MDELTERQRAVELLQQFGLKEYDAKSFVALSRIPRGTAKDISEISEVPRTRVYDAVRVLETRGLVEIQHSNPQVFRAISIAEAAGTLRAEFESRTERLEEALRNLEPADLDGDAAVTHEVWALSEGTAITNRAQRLVDEAERELVLLVGHESVVTERLLDRLRTAGDRGVAVVVGTTTEEVRERVSDALPDAEVFVSGLSWMDGSKLADDDTEISRLLLVDRNTILVSSFHAAGTGERTHEHAVFGRGFDNGFVTIVRRLMAVPLLSDDGAGVAVLEDT